MANDSGVLDAAPANRLSKIRHDLKTPLNQIIGYTEMLIEDAQDADADEISIEKLSCVLERAQACLNVQNRVLSQTPESLTEMHWRELREEQRTRCHAMTADVDWLRSTGRDGTFAADLAKIANAIASLEELSGSAEDRWASDTAFVSTTPPGVASVPAALADAPLWLTESDGNGEARSGAVNGGGRLLVVDDNAGNRDMLARRLRREGYSVATAADGSEALERLGAEVFDLVLLDVVMPEVDGFAVLQQIRAKEQWRETAVIMISAIDEIKSVVRCIEMGAEDYLPKPFDPVLLRARIGAILDRKRLRQAERLRAAQVENALREAEEQKHNAESMLRNILPGKIAAQLQAKGTVEPMYFEDVTIGFTDFVGFTVSTEHLAAEEIVGLLHQYFTAFDQIAERYGLEKLKTIGDSYMFVSGMPERKPSHPVDAVLAALEMAETVRRMAEPPSPVQWRVRIGLHTGPVIAGVVGIHKFAFDIWGDSVNFSSRMESSGAPNRVNLSERTYSRVKDFISCTPRGQVRIKDGRDVDMYFADGIQPKLLGGEGPIPENFARRYKIYFEREVKAFPSFLSQRIPETNGACV
ncbi:MAG: adenylate/guanylate cyclase domain-containing protein [Bryobacteraceae bacterium]